MSIETLNAVWRQSKARPTPRSVLAVIANFTNANGVAWPSMQTLSKMTGWPVRTVRRAIRELEQIGELVVEIGGVHRSNRYRVTLTDGRPGGSSGATERQGERDRGSRGRGAGESGRSGRAVRGREDGGSSEPKI